MNAVRVIILEDDAGVLSVIEAAVSDEAFDFMSFGTVKALFDSDALTTGDLFLVDIHLPDGDGLDVVQAIRKTNPRVGIIVLSGRSDEIDKVLGLELGADDYVTKPFRPRELRARVKAVLRRLAPATQERDALATDVTSQVEVISTLKIHRRARHVYTSQDVLIPLTTLEHDVLIALVTPANTVLSRDQIMDRVRGPDWAAFDRAIDGIISRLRLKLAAAGVTKDVIKTVRGVGYMFSVGS